MRSLIPSTLMLSLSKHGRAPLTLRQAQGERFVIAHASLLAALLFLAGCATVPVSGRRSLVLVSEGQELSLGEQSYKEILKSSKLSSDAEAAAMVRRVGERIAKVSD